MAGRVATWVIALLLAVGITLNGSAPAWAGPFELGIRAVEHQDYGVAVQAFTTAIAQGDHASAAYGNRCLIQLWGSQLTQAIADCTAALRLNPDAPQAYLNRGLAHYRLGRYEAAQADFSRHLQHWPQDGLAYYNRGLAAMALGNTAGAIADYQQALSLGEAVPDETQANIYNDLGVAYLAQAQPVVAVAYLDQAISLNRDDPRAYFNHGCACHHRGDNLTALASFEQALALDPTHAETYLNRAMVRGELGDQVGAMTDLQQAQTYFQQRGDQRGSNQARSLLMQWQQQSIAIG